MIADATVALVPAAQPNLISLTTQFQQAGTATPEIIRGLRLFNAYAPEFRRESDRLSPPMAEQEP